MAEQLLQAIKIALVIAPDQFRDEELFTPKESFEAAGAQTYVAASSLNESRGMLGKVAKPDLLIKDLESMHLDALVIVGGMGSPQYLWQDTTLHKIIAAKYKEGKVIAAICVSSVVLANAGILENKEATVWEMPESLKALEEGKARYINKPVVVDGKIITANGPEAALEFATTIIEKLSKITSKI